ncbi:30S ribosomal protein S17 [Candidatus Dependentiae bacterium]|nr:30S ribosomal protein S17 [Candidatus Dependentiae bacterium]
MTTNEEKSKRTLVGVVVSDKMDKTVVVEIKRLYKDERFHKYLKKTKKYKVHDELSQAKKGDVIEFCEGRPLSKTKSMYLKRIVKTQAVES